MKKYIFIQSILIMSIVSGLILEAGDIDAAYKKNFYKAVNKEWLATHEIPADKSSTSTFVDIDTLFIQNAKELLSDLMQKNRLNKDEEKILNYYNSFLNMKQRNAKGITPLTPLFMRIDTVENYESLAHIIAQMNQEAFVGPYAFSIINNPNDATKYVLTVGQSGLGLQKKFYDDNSSGSVVKRKNYADYMRTMLTLGKFSDVNKTVSNTLKVENILARYSYTLLDQLDVKKTTHITNFDTLNKMLSNFDLVYYFKQADFPTDIEINIAAPEYFKALNRVYKQIPLDMWKSYLKTKILLLFGANLGEDFVAAVHHYNVKEGKASEQEPLEIRALRDTSTTLSYLFGKVYVQRYFNDAIKSKVETILKSILEEYRIAIKNTNRFSDETKKAALRKIDYMAFNIAYPNKWHDYSSYKTKKDDLMFNTMELIKFMHKRDVDKLKRRVVDNEIWEGYPPQDINAYYSAQSNKFVLLAGILNPPVFDINNSDAANYGGIGMVIGHEIGHAFDRNGAQYDEKGNLKNWWSKEDLDKFNKLNAALIAQAKQFEVVPGVYANGELEVGEIQADLSGATIALRAYLRTLEGNEKVKTEGIKNFYIQFAKTWKSKSLAQVLVILNDSDGHPVAEYRINGTVKNMDTFYKAFSIKEGDGMYLSPEKRVKIW